MNATENLRCIGSDCAATPAAGTDWFGDLEISEEPEEASRDQYGDRF